MGLEPGSGILNGRERRFPASLLPRYFPRVNFHPTIRALGILLLCAACSGKADLETGNLPASARSMASVSVLRLPKEGGLARLYRVPGARFGSVEACRAVATYRADHWS